MRALLLPFLASCFANAYIPSKTPLKDCPWKSHHSNIHHQIRHAVPSKDADLSNAAPSPDDAEENKALTPQATRTVKDYDSSRQSNVDKWRIAFPQCRIPDDSPLLLPEIREEDQGKKCLVLDLDDTLIYTDYSKNEHDADIYFEIEVCNIRRRSNR
jgi:hypothetical protein